MKNLLDNYYQVVARVDALCQEIHDVLASQIKCKEGCSICCKAITFFPVEAAALNAALDTFSEVRRTAIFRHVAAHAKDDYCPLLENNRCLLYAARPIICRTHGLPIIFTEESTQKVDCCPLNLSGHDQAISGSAIIDLDKLNILLMAVNALFISNVNDSSLPERLTIADALKVKL